MVRSAVGAAYLCALEMQASDVVPIYIIRCMYVALAARLMNENRLLKH